MKLLTEADLRALCLPAGFALPLPAGTVLTPAARDYCAERGITVCTEKPEHMTQLRGELLVPKTHPSIKLRGKLDSLEALLLQGIAQARELGREQCAAGLQDCFNLAQAIMAAEVKEQALPSWSLLGLDSAALRHASHNPRDWAGIPYPTPHAGMSALCLALNFLRTQVRECERAACEALAHRTDMIEALNRMSSAVYLLFLKELVG